jgi:pimeloyl-ACP methyl ester carboxylesterase
MLQPPVAGDRRDVDGLACWWAGSGEPLLLVHSVNAAASAAEVRPVFDTMKATHRVAAIELPGFGSSPRADIDYTPRRMTDAVLAGAAALQRDARGLPVAALALSLGCEFLARAATERPSLFSRLVLVSPTGLAGRQARDGATGGTREVPGLHAALRAPWWSQALFAALTRPGVVRYFLKRSFGRDQIDEPMWAYAVATAREPGARLAPLAFLSGKLFSADIGAIYEAIEQPVWMTHGTRGDFTDYRGKARLQGRANWTITVIEGGALPYFEQREAFNARLAAFLAGATPLDH